MSKINIIFVIFYIFVYSFFKKKIYGGGIYFCWGEHNYLIHLSKIYFVKEIVLIDVNTDPSLSI